MVCKVLLDMDGVLTNFNKAYHDFHKIHPDEVMLSYEDAYKKFYGINPDVAKAIKAKRLKGHLWDMFVQERLFERLELMPDAHMLLNHINALRRDGLIRTVEICSSAGGLKHYDTVAKQKKKWLDENGFRYTKQNITVNGIAKANHIDKSITTVLIDDTDYVIENFRKNGGFGILHTDAESTSKKLTELTTALRS